MMLGTLAEVTHVMLRNKVESDEEEALLKSVQAWNELCGCCRDEGRWYCAR
jgi:hypothetical protein